MDAFLLLEDGTRFRGRSFGAAGGGQSGAAAPFERFGEVVFNTAMSGYQEVLTDPSYRGQIVVMTVPHVGNYGINDEDGESSEPQVAGFVVREVSPAFSNQRGLYSLDFYLAKHGVAGLSGVDTRALTRHLRSRGAMRGVIAGVAAPARFPPGDSAARGEEGGAVSADLRLAESLARLPPMEGRDLVLEVTAREPYLWRHGRAVPAGSRLWDTPAGGAMAGRVAVYDYGVKRNILRRLESAGLDVAVLPAQFPAADLLALAPDGVVLSNGPGDPAALPYAVGAARELLGRVPIFGICLGHQVLARALGASTYKLKFGHRGANHPVKDLRRGVVEITSQNHGFSVGADNLPAEIEVTHTNLNDGTIEGFRHRGLPVFAVQYHPEAAPGPHDSDYLFGEFKSMLPAPLAG